jgi:hypothetical protein
VSAGLADTCTWNISCEKISKTEYACHSSGEFISTSAKIIREIPAGKYGADTIAKKSSFREESVGYDREKRISYV